MERIWQVIWFARANPTASHIYAKLGNMPHVTLVLSYEMYSDVMSCFEIEFDNEINFFQISTADIFQVVIFSFRL